MRRGRRRASVCVCLIEPNPLAFSYLQGLLRRDSQIELRPIESLPPPPEAVAHPLIFILDNYGLALPLSECLRRLRFHYPDAKFIVLDRDLPKEDLLRLLWIKIDGFVPYPEVPVSLMAAVRSVALQNIWVPREILREYVQCAREIHQPNSQKIEDMTSRETQILELVRRRLSNKEIAEILRVRESTVKFHLSNIYSKLQVASRYDIIKENESHSGAALFVPLFAPSTPG